MNQLSDNTLFEEEPNNKMNGRKEVYTNLIKEIYQTEIKNLPVYFSIIIIFLLFNEKINDAINSFSENYISAYFINLVGILSLILLLLLGIYLYIKDYHYLYNDKISTIIKVIFLLIALDVLFIKYYDYETFKDKQLYFPYVLVIFPLLILLQLGIKFRHTSVVTKTVENQQNSPDVAIRDVSQDDFYFELYLDSFYEYIKNLPYNDSFTVGIDSVWGSGKTSYINLLKIEFKKDDKFFLLEFNPWRYSNSVDVIKGFLNELKSSIYIDHNVMKNIIDKYSNKVSASDENLVFGLFKNIFSDEEDLESMYTKINDYTQKKGKKVIVIIDDIDRLNNEEVYEVLKLVRNTANFKNFIFIVAYDRMYIEHALKSLNIYKEKNYLDKIINYHIEVPPISPEALINHLNKKTLKYLNYDIFIIEKYKPGLIKLFRENLNTVRDVHLYINGLLFYYGPVSLYCDIAEFMVVELLRVKFSSFYERLKIDHTQSLYVDHTDKKTLVWRSDSNESANGILEYLFSGGNNNVVNKYNTIRDINKIELYFNSKFNRSDLVNVYEEGNKEKWTNEFLKKLDNFRDIAELICLLFNKVYFAKINDFLDNAFLIDKLYWRHSELIHTKSLVDEFNNLFLADFERYIYTYLSQVGLSEKTRIEILYKIEQESYPLAFCYHLVNLTLIGKLNIIKPESTLSIVNIVCEKVFNDDSIDMFFKNLYINLYSILYISRPETVIKSFPNLKNYIENYKKSLLNEKVKNESKD